MSAADVLWFVALFCASILAGAALATASSVVPALRTFAAEDDLRVRGVFVRLADRVVPPLLVASVAAAIALLVVDGGLGSGATALVAIGLGLSAAIVAVSLLARRVGDARRWDRVQLARTALILGALGCYAVAATPESTRGPDGGIEWLQAAAVYLAALMAGGLVLVAVALVPTFHRLPAPLSVRTHVAVDRYIEYSLPPLTVATILVSTAVLAVRGHVSAASLALTAIGIGGAIWVALNSHLINRPMNQRIRGLGDASSPEYDEIRRRWDFWHSLRTLAGVAAGVCLIVAFLAA